MRFYDSFFAVFFNTKFARSLFFVIAIVIAYALLLLFHYSAVDLLWCAFVLCIDYDDNVDDGDIIRQPKVPSFSFSRLISVENDSAVPILQSFFLLRYRCIYICLVFSKPIEFNRTLHMLHKKYVLFNSLISTLGCFYCCRRRSVFFGCTFVHTCSGFGIISH